MNGAAFNFVVNNNHYNVFVNDDGTWEEAKETCKHADGWLAKVESDTVLEDISAKLDSTEESDMEGIDNLWIGLHLAQWEWHHGN